MKKLLELQRKHTLRCVAFTPSGGWVVFWDQNGHWTTGLPDAATRKLAELAAKGSTLRSIAFAPDGGWVVLHGETGVWYSGVPDDLAQYLTRGRNGCPVTVLPSPTSAPGSPSPPAAVRPTTATTRWRSSLRSFPAGRRS